MNIYTGYSYNYIIMTQDMVLILVRPTSIKRESLYTSLVTTLFKFPFIIAVLNTTPAAIG